MTRETRYKYPRTPHCPLSPGASPDDEFAHNTHLAGREVVLTEKFDGECTSIYRDGHHARSLDSSAHPSRHHIAALAGELGHQLPPGLRLCGENVTARHSLAYTNLPGYFLLFSVWAGTECLSWDETQQWAELLSIPTVPVIWRGTFTSWKDLHTQWEHSGRSTETSEGWVVRDTGSFSRTEFSHKIAKWVRRGHVTTPTFWMHQELVYNQLAASGEEPRTCPAGPQ